MQGAKLGDKVLFSYTIKDEGGDVLEKIEEDSPEELVLGQGDTIPGIEVSLVGMNVGDKKSVTLDPPMHFGSYIDELKFDIPKETIPGEIKIEKGGVLEYEAEDGTSEFFTILSIGDEMISIDGNHPYAGKQLSVDIKVHKLNG